MSPKSKVERNRVLFPEIIQRNKRAYRFDPEFSGIGKNGIFILVYRPEGSIEGIGLSDLRRKMVLKEREN